MTNRPHHCTTERLKHLLAKATPLPWYQVRSERRKMYAARFGAVVTANLPINLPGATEQERYAAADANADLVLAAMNALPELLAEIDRLRTHAGEHKEPKP
jgi:hypothetical protein